MTRKVTAVIGALPEVEGFALARFSRSKPETSFEDWILALSRERAESFYEQFYHTYGHASIADLAHVGLAVENISIVAAVALLDEPLLDAQERSTRYVDFNRASFYTPPEIAGGPYQSRYESLCGRLFEEYNTFHARLTEHLARAYAPLRPKDLDDKGFDATVRAKAFDVARYLLPASTLTGVGIVASGRTLERHISRLLSEDLAELRSIGVEMKQALVERPALNPIQVRLAEAMRKSAPLPDGLNREVDFHTYKDCVPLPTLVKYARPSSYALNLRRAVREIAATLDSRLPTPDSRRDVTLSKAPSLEIEIAAGLLYAELPHSYRQILEYLAEHPDADRELAALVEHDRGLHDAPPRALAAGYDLTLDVCMDNGSFRDLHRHRNCIQILKAFDHRLGYDLPDEIRAAGLEERYVALHREILEHAEQIHRAAPAAVPYLLPLSFRRRTLFKMNLWELQYIVELRSRPAGHFSYRDIARRMYEAAAARHPEVARFIHPAPERPEDFFVR
ncbi:MAG: FAD-dependent thymidylate synthase [Nitrospirae bacterium]|nr:FAD-dependent thymidylate synthase [Nitrospirota bacterium]